MAIGKVIKGEGSGDSGAGDAPVRPVLRPPRAGVVGAEEFEARQSAQSIVADATERAKSIIAEAEAQRDAKLAEGREAGRQEGYGSVTELLLKAKVASDEMLASVEPEAVKLALRIAEKIIGHDVERDPGLLMDTIAQATEAARNAQQLTIRVHPEVGKFLRGRMPQLMEKIGVTKVVSIKDDAEITDKGGCVLETPFGTIDARLQTQLEVLKQTLLPDTAKKEVK